MTSPVLPLTASLTAPESTAVLRWTPHLEADFKKIFGTRPDAMMTLQYDDEDSRMVAIAQLSIAVLLLKAIDDTRFPPVLSADMKLLSRVVLRLNGMTDAQIDEIDKRKGHHRNGNSR